MTRGRLAGQVKNWGVGGSVVKTGMDDICQLGEEWVCHMSVRN